MEKSEKSNYQDKINVWDVFPNSEFHTYLDGLKSKEQEYYLNYCYIKHYYWIFFLPLPKHAHILVVDDTPGLVSMLLVFMGHHVVTITENADKRNFWDKYIYEANKGSYNEKLGDISDVLDGAEDKYDAIIINDLVHVKYFESSVSKNVADIIGRLTTSIKEEGVLWIGGDNPYYFKNYFNRKSVKCGGKKIWPQVFAALLKEGASIEELHELKPCYNMPEEVALLTNKKEKKAEYQERLENKPGGVREFIKKYLPKNIKHRYLSPAYGVLFIFNGKSENASMIRELGSELFGSESCLENIYLGNPDTLILKLAHGGRNKIARLPFTKEAKERCDRSQKALESLDWLRNDKVKLAPVPGKKLRLNGLQVYTESAIIGESIGDVVCRGIDFVNSATEIITELHLKTSKNTVITEDVFQELIGTLISRLEDNVHPSLSSNIEWLSAYFKKSFIGKNMPIVFSHGDYKLENLMVNGDCNLIGVIDWDLSAERGMPLIDLIHLLAYEKHDKNNQPIAEVIMKQWVPGLQFLDKDDRILVDQYMSELNIPSELFKPLVSIYWLDNVAKRFSTNGKYFNNEFVEKFVLPVFDEIKENTVNEQKI